MKKNLNNLSYIVWKVLRNVNSPILWIWGALNILYGLIRKDQLSKKTSEQKKLFWFDDVKSFGLLKAHGIYYGIMYTQEAGCNSLGCIYIYYWEIFQVLIKFFFIFNCRHVSSFRDSSVLSEVSKNFFKIERIRIRDI